MTSCVVRGEFDQAEYHADEMRQLGEVHNDPMWKCVGSLSSGNICWWLGMFVEASRYYEDALSLWNPSYRTNAVLPEDPYISALLFFSKTLCRLGYVEQAQLRRAARGFSPYARAWGLCLAWAEDWAIEGVNSAPNMLRSADEVLAMSTEYPHWVGFGNIMRGWCLATLGRASEGIPVVLQEIALRRSTGSKLTLPFHLTMLAEVYRMAAQPEEGLKRVNEAASLVETTKERWAEADMHRVQGTLLLSKNEHVAAEESYQRALAVARHQNAKFWELRAALDLARLWRDQGKRTEARDLLTPVYCWFTEGFDTPVLQEAKALLDELA